MNKAQAVKTAGESLVGKTVFFRKTEEVWERPYTMKRHHVYDTRSVILRGEVIEEKGNEFKAKLADNNGFEKDGETFVFQKNNLLCDQNFKDFKSLGAWEHSWPEKEPQ